MCAAAVKSPANMTEALGMAQNCPRKKRKGNMTDFKTFIKANWKPLSAGAGAGVLIVAIFAALI